MSIFNKKLIKELQNENEELKKHIDSLAEKENQLKRFDELVKKARMEYAEIATRKDQTAQSLETLEKDKAKLIGELSKISSEIKQLREMKMTENDQLISLRNAFDNSDFSLADENDRSSKTKHIISKEIEAAEKRKNYITSETSRIRKEFESVNNKVIDSKKVLNKLNANIEKKKEEISNYILKQNSISQNRDRNFNSEIEDQSAEEINDRVSELINKEKELIEKLAIRKQQLDELGKQIAEKRMAETDKTDFVKKDMLHELNIKIEAKEAQLLRITNELKSKTELHNDLVSDNKKILEDLKFNREELARLNNSIEIETIRLTDLDYSLTFLEDEFDRTSNDISEKLKTKEELDFQINEKINQKIELEDILKELKETTSIIARLKHDIEKGSGQSAKRFTSVLQYYSTSINDFYKKKNDIEKILIQQEKELKNNQHLIEKQKSIVEEMDNVLFVRHRKADLIEDLTRAISEQRLSLEKMNSELNNSEKNKDVVNSSISQKKLLEYENALNDILRGSDKYASQLINTRTTLDKEISENKNRLNELNQNIRIASGELSELQNSLRKIKIEHEEHRVSINKLASIKTKLNDQIDMHKTVIDKYSEIKEKIREEQELIKIKRDSTDSSKISLKSTEAEKHPGPHNPKWIKL